MSLRDRLKAIADYKKLDVRGFEVSVGLSNGYVNNAGNSIRPASLDKILEKYPEINKVWLITGEGRMISEPKLEAVPLYLSDPEGFESTGEKYYELADGSIMIEVPVIPVKAYAGYLRGWPDPEYYEDKEILRINVDKRFSGTYMCFEVKGESMVNIETKELARRTLWPGSRIIGRDLPKDAWHKSKLHYKSNDAWIIVHRELGIITKEIIDHDVENGIITIHSLNPDKEEYPDQKLDLRDIEQLFNVVDPMKLRH